MVDYIGNHIVIVLLPRASMAVITMVDYIAIILSVSSFLSIDSSNNNGGLVRSNVRSSLTSERSVYSRNENNRVEVLSPQHYTAQSSPSAPPPQPGLCLGLCGHHSFDGTTVALQSHPDIKECPRKLRKCSS